MNDAHNFTAARVPTVYFIDDSATMREVIKIAFRKENIHVITCPDAASALSQFSGVAPDAVITDVIMPDKDGYEVCQFIKQHEQLCRTPVILMSGVVNRSVAEKAMAVKADELIRKPFQPHELILRIKNLLNPKPAVAPSTTIPPDSSHALSSLFSPGATASSGGPIVSRPENQGVALVQPVLTAVQAPPVQQNSISTAEIQKLRNENQRLQLLVRKLQAEIEAERQYCAALETHFKTLQESV
jgi:DNA-binding response OmpR family regulator